MTVRKKQLFLPAKLAGQRHQLRRHLQALRRQQCFPQGPVRVYGHKHDGLDSLCAQGDEAIVATSRPKREHPHHTAAGQGLFRRRLFQVEVVSPPCRLPLHARDRLQGRSCALERCWGTCGRCLPTTLPITTVSRATPVAGSRRVLLVDGDRAGDDSAGARRCRVPTGRGGATALSYGACCQGQGETRGAGQAAIKAAGRGRARGSHARPHGSPSRGGPQGQMG